MGEAGKDPIKLEQAFIMFKINGGALQAYQMDRVETQNDGFRRTTGMQHTFSHDLVVADEIEYSFHYTYKGVPYSSEWETFTVQW